MDSNQTEACNATIAGAIAWVVVVHWSFVAVFGTLNYVLALWCVASCTMTKRPMKVLMISMFVPALLVSVMLGMLLASVLLFHLSCSSEEIIKIVLIVVMMYMILELMELACIAFIAVARAVVVWSPRGSELGMGAAAALVVSAYAYPFVIMSLVLLGYVGALWTGVQQETTDPVLLLVYPCLCMVFPILLTIVAYALMIVAVQRNKRRLAASESQPRPVPVMDPATRGMLAVFITKLVFALPYAIINLVHNLSDFVHGIFLLWFIVQHVVAPLVFIYFNLHHRRRVLDLLVACKTRIAYWLPHLYTSEISTSTQSLTENTQL